MKYRALSKKEAGGLLLAIGLGAYALALVQYINASVPTGTGRWSWLYSYIFSYIYSHLGNAGLVAFWFLLGSFLIVKGWRHGNYD
jgi:hypothetical protein